MICRSLWASLPISAMADPTMGMVAIVRPACTLPSISRWIVELAASLMVLPCLNCSATSTQNAASWCIPRWVKSAAHSLHIRVASLLLGSRVILLCLLLLSLLWFQTKQRPIMVAL